MDQPIPFNYFYTMFNTECRKNTIRNMQTKISEGDRDDIFLDFFYQTLDNKENLEIYNESLFECCANYISLSKSSRTVYPNNGLQFAKTILEEIENNPYQESFIMSLQFIYQDYLTKLGIGTPSLCSYEEEETSPYMEITLDAKYQITKFETVNMSLLEQTKIITDFLLLESSEKLGPFQNIKYQYRKDI